MAHRLLPHRSMAVMLGVLVLGGASLSAQNSALVPTSPALSESVTTVMEQPWLTEPERRQMRLFHGVWDQRDLVTPQDRAQAAMMLWQIDDSVFADPSVTRELHAEAQLRQGQPESALEIVIGSNSLRSLRLRAEAQEHLGHFEAAQSLAATVVEQVNQMENLSAEDLTEQVRALRLLQRLGGQPATGFQSMMSLIGKVHQQVDRLYWPAKLVEAEILFEKQNYQEATAALHEVLALNPRSSQAWYLLGQIALENMLFEQAERAAEILSVIESQHPLAALLLADIRLFRNDPEGALEIAQSVIEKWPRFVEPHIQVAVAYALLYDRKAADEQLLLIDELLPHSPRPFYIVGRHLLKRHQYDAAKDYLDEARRRRPTWAAPVIELSRIALQTGRADEALVILQQATKLDPFHIAAANFRFLLEELAEYDLVETEHFVIRYKPGVDEVLVAMMPDVMEEIYASITKTFDFEPPGKTYLEVMPDHQRFSVRIVGMPDVHTVAACTGPVIAMEVPRSGQPSRHKGTFDWPRVLKHEFTHTVNLAQSKNRVPRWLTEGAAVQMEGAGRTYERNVMLANALEVGELFTMDEIDWAFIRPKRPGDIGQAYSQGNWMVEFIINQWGMPKLVDLLERMQQGDRPEAAFKTALGVDREQFFAGFLVWAERQVQQWGLAPEPSVEMLMDQLIASNPKLKEAAEIQASKRLERIARRLAGEVGEPSGPGRQPTIAEQWPAPQGGTVPISDEVLDRWLGAHPTHPDLIEMKMSRLLDREEVSDEQRIEWLERYVDLRPIDPAPRRQLIKLFGAEGPDQRAQPHLEVLDRAQTNSPVYAVQLAEIYRQNDDLERALDKVTRAVSIHPYHAPYRELAAAIAIEAGAFEKAKGHIIALAILEPDRPLHSKRLNAIEQLLEQQAGNK